MNITMTRRLPPNLSEPAVTEALSSSRGDLVFFGVSTLLSLGRYEHENNLEQFAAPYLFSCIPYTHSDTFVFINAFSEEVKFIHFTDSIQAFMRNIYY